MEIKVVKQILEWNEDVSREVQKTLKDHNVIMINVMGSPGAGKTSLIKRIINRLSGEYRIAVIEGDIAGTIDAQTIDKMGIPVVQLQTDGACHIEAMSVQNMLPMFDLENIDVILVENIGNLVCPAEFNIGEDLRVSILSIPEGDDKVEKYPLMFTLTDAIILNKYDMLQYFDFDEMRVRRNAEDINPDAEIFAMSAKDGNLENDFIEWLKERINEKIRG